MIILSDQNSDLIFIFNIEFCTTQLGYPQRCLTNKTYFQIFLGFGNFPSCTVTDEKNKDIFDNNIIIKIKIQFVQFEYPQSRNTVLLRFYQ